MLSRRLPLIAVLIVSLACSFLTRSLAGAPTPAPTASNTPTITATALAAAYIPPGCESHELATQPAATELAVPTPAIRANAPIDPQVQMRVFEKTVQAVSDNYVYPDFNGKDWNAIVTETRTRVQGGLSTEDFCAAMQSLIDALGDDHSRFESPVDVAQEQADLTDTSHYVGIGVEVEAVVDKQILVVTGVFPDSPAEHSGIQVHDSLISVDGLPLVQGGQVYSYRVRGPECSAAQLIVRSPGQPDRTLLVVRHRISGDIPVGARLLPTSDGSKVGYIVLPSFFDQKIPEEVVAALLQFGKLDGLIIDNRTNPGGSSDILEKVLSHFTSGDLGTYKSRTSARSFIIQADPIANSQTVPLVVLVGLDTASFGEISSGVLQDSGRAKIVGETTLGNVEVLHAHDFEDGSRMWLAEERFDPAHSHANWEATGIVPDVQAFADWDTFTFDTDPAIRAALMLLGH